MNAYEAGLHPNEFWSLTLKELSLFVQAYRRRQKQEGENMTTTAWLMATLSRAKRIPSLNRLLPSRMKARVLHGEEAERERKRHEELVKRLGADATATEEDLERFIRGQTAQTTR